MQGATSSRIRSGAALLIAMVVSACGGADLGESPNTTTQPPRPSTTVSPGWIGDQPITVETLEVEVGHSSADLVVTGFVPSSCHHGQFGFDEPDSHNVMTGSAESWLEPNCPEPDGPGRFEETVSITGLEPGDYTVRLPGAEDLHFSVPEPPPLASLDESSLQASCGSIPIPGGAKPSLPDTPLDAEALQAMEAMTTVGAEPFFFNQYEWFIGDRTPERLELFGRSSTEPGTDAPGYAYAVFSPSGDGWDPQGLGQCAIEISAAGYGTADWEVEQRPGPSSTQLFLLITERACASGEAPVDRTIVPVVVNEPDRVTITVLVEPVQGGADCPGNPPHPVTVELTEPLGQRRLFDGSQFPNVEITWPPGESGLDE